MMSDSTYRCLTLWVLAFLVVSVVAQDFSSIEDDVRQLIARRKNLEYMRQFVEDMDHQLKGLQKRTCYYNAGMSHNCDYKEMNKNINDETIWNEGPGKRKRSMGTPDNKEDVRTFLRSMKVLAESRRRR